MRADGAWYGEACEGEGLPRRASMPTIPWSAALSASAATPRPAFANRGDFLKDARREVDAYLADAAIRRRGLRRLYLKACLAVLLIVVGWVALILQQGVVVSIAALVVLDIGVLLTAVCVAHDANHGSFFGRRRLDHVVGFCADALCGFSSYAWRIRHNVAHHTYTNVDGEDSDVTQLPVLRLTPSQPVRAWHRYQHRYAWLLYALMALRLQTYGDVVVFARERIGRTTLRRPTGWTLVALVGGKLLFVLWAVVVPLLLFPWWLVVPVYVAMVMAMSLAMVMIFQLAHCVEEAAFPTTAEITAARTDWATHELETTVNFCPGNRFLTFVLGGLNFQIEHHLFPRVPHTHYPAIAPIVARQAQAHGLPYVSQPSLRRAMRSHSRHLRSLSESGQRLEIEMG